MWNCSDAGPPVSTAPGANTRTSSAGQGFDSRGRLAIVSVMCRLMATLGPAGAVAILNSDFGTGMNWTEVPRTEGENPRARLAAESLASAG
jgi:hypothetical protein